MLEHGDALPIDNAGDLVLVVSQDEAGDEFAFRVASKALCAHSRYFENMLSNRFDEGRRLAAAREALGDICHSKMMEVPTRDLPRIAIHNIGRIFISKESNIQALTADFFRVLHGQDLASAAPPVPNLANLAVVADRFDAVECLSSYVQRKKYLQTIDARLRGRPTTSISEERARQKLLVGLLMDHPSWVTQNSKYLILRDSRQWQPSSLEDHTKPLWWDLPLGVEDELIQRREYILDTINSLQSHFLKLYTSGERQCKLGYDTSIQCDSFQLGEMVRFFTKTNTLRLQGTIYDSTDPSYYSGDIGRLLETLRQCSEYQIDRNHTHCGLRTRLLPLLDLLQNRLSLETTSLDIGICLECWQHQRPLYAWSWANRPVLWNRPKALAGFQGHAPAAGLFSQEYGREPSSCVTRHVAARDFFMAMDKNWTA